MITLQQVRDIWDIVADGMSPDLTWQLNACQPIDVEPGTHLGDPSVLSFGPIRGYEIVVTQMEGHPMLCTLDNMFSSVLRERVELAYQCPRNGRTPRWLVRQLWEQEQKVEDEKIWAEIEATASPQNRYRDHLASSEWRMRRQAMLWLADGRCQVCNSSDETLDTHHRTYERLGHERPEDLIVLCRKCHQLFHDNGKLVVPQP